VISMISTPVQYGRMRIVTGAADWQGSFRTGTGTISTASRTFDHAPYTYASRFEGTGRACPGRTPGAATPLFV
jgi:lipoyl-dependent peroxiredoxin